MEKSLQNREKSSKNKKFNENYLSISEFYKNKCIFITGASGFIGKLLIEKLLRSCPKIKNIFILMRSKKGIDIQDRLSEIFKSELFDKIRIENPDTLHKVIPISGDIKLPNFGISAEDQETLNKNVSLIFHSAATIRFDEKLKEAIEVNFMGTKRLVELSKKFRILEAFVHISTAFSNCNKTDIDEVFYELPFDIDGLINFVEKFPEDIVENCTNQLLCGHPNTYTLTKAMTELMLKKETDFPISIVRPSLVSGCMNEPFCGWVENYSGPTMSIATHGKGICHTFLCSPKFPCEIVPADFVVNSLIAIGWKTAIENSSKKLIYHVTSGDKNPILWEDASVYAEKAISNYPFEGMFWYPSRHIGSNKLVYIIYVIFTQYIPAYFVDFLLKICGQKPFLIKIQDKVFNINKAVEFFKFKKLNFHGNNIDNLLDLMSKDDRKKFQFDVREINWEKFVQNLTLGIRKYIFKQDPKTLDSCRRKLFGYKILHYLMKSLLIFGIINLIYKIFIV